MIKLLPSIHTTLSQMTILAEYRESAADAQSLLNNITFKFVVSRTISHVLLSATTELCKKLQGEDNFIVSMIVICSR